MERVYRKDDMPRVVYDTTLVFGGASKFIVYRTCSEDEVLMHAKEKNFDINYLEDKDVLSRTKNGRRFYLVASGLVYDSPTSHNVLRVELYYTEISSDRYFAYIRDKAKHVENVIRSRDEDFNRSGSWPL